MEIGLAKLERAWIILDEAGISYILANEKSDIWKLLKGKATEIEIAESGAKMVYGIINKLLTEKKLREFYCLITDKNDTKEVDNIDIENVSEAIKDFFLNMFAKFTPLVSIFLGKEMKKNLKGIRKKL